VALSSDLAALRVRANARAQRQAARVVSNGYNVAEPIVFKMSLSVGLLTIIQSITPSLICICTLYLSTLIWDVGFGRNLVVLASLAAALAAPMLQPPRTVAPSALGMASLPLALKIVWRWMMMLAILLAIGYLTKYADDYARRTVLTWAMITPPLLIAASLTTHELMRRLLMSPANARSAVFVGCNLSSLALAERLTGNSELCIRVEGFFDDRSSERLCLDNGVRVLGRLEDLSAYVKRRGTQVIFVSLPVTHMKRVKDLLDELQDTTASIYYLPDIISADLIQARSGEILGVPVVAMCETPFYGYRGVLKRLTDIVVSAGSLLLLAPFLMAVALAVKATSQGPSIFKQRRYGLDGRPFSVYKFRTMTVAEDGDVVRQATATDARVTPIGRWLRKYSIDELPQLINVLQGRMSLVGPRPHAVAHNEMYRKVIKGYMIRHKVLPGMTGLAQVSGLRGETRSVEEMEARVQCDLEYLRNWSFWLDMKILIFTALKVVRDNKAY
jgi:putative colanic acid biosynthesis UDP-glucose lipid carrier transferase